MIKLTRLNGKVFHLNALLIETVESFPDTTILLTNGKRYVIQESEDEVIQLTMGFYRSIQMITINQQEEENPE